MPAPNPQDVQFIIARFAEDLQWILQPRFQRFVGNTIVYNKGDDDLSLGVTNAVKQVIRLPNLGRCDHTYLLHIVHGLINNTLANYTVFLCGSVYSASPDKTQRFYEIMEFLEHGTPIPCKLFNMSGQYTFSMETYGATSKDNLHKNPEGKLWPSPIRPLGKWAETIFPHVNLEHIPYVVRGVFVGRRDCIQETPVKTYMEMLSHVGMHSNPEVGHYIERMWGYLLYRGLFRTGEAYEPLPNTMGKNTVVVVRHQSSSSPMPPSPAHNSSNTTNPSINIVPQTVVKVINSNVPVSKSTKSIMVKKSPPSNSVVRTQPIRPSPNTPRPVRRVVVAMNKDAARPKGPPPPPPRVITGVRMAKSVFVKA